MSKTDRHAYCFSSGFESYATHAFFNAPHHGWVAEALSWDLDVKFTRPTGGYWDGGQKSGGTFHCEPATVFVRAERKNSPERIVPAIQVGSWELNTFIRVAVSNPFFSNEAVRLYGATNASGLKKFQSRVREKLRPLKGGTTRWAPREILTHVLAHADGEVEICGISGGKPVSYRGRDIKELVRKGMEERPRFDVEVRMLLSSQCMAIDYENDFYFPVLLTPREDTLLHSRTAAEVTALLKLDSLWRWTKTPARGTQLLYRSYLDPIT